jgi:predicted AlkP superfamily phosphohydrolase/phosphomutase
VAARVLLLGFDAVDTRLVERWAAEGLLPAFARLSAEATRVELASSHDALPEPVWLELATGMPAAEIGWYAVPRQIVAGEPALRPIRPDDIAVSTVWERAAAAGRRVAALDVP